MNAKQNRSLRKVSTATWGRALLAAAALGLLWVIGSTMRNRQEQQLAEEIALRQSNRDETSLPASSVAATQVIRLTDSVIADSGRIRGEWVVHLKDQFLPGARLPAKPTAEGRLATPRPAVDPRPQEPNQGYLGAQACAACHKERHASFVQTTHFRSSRPATRDAVMGPLEPPGNEAASSDPELSFTITHDHDRMHQRIELGDWTASIPADVIIGSGKLAQTFLFWHGDGLYENHLSYFPDVGRWLTSPGFEHHTANFSRPIRADCLECHATYIARKKKPNFYYKDSVLWGISCERCHGPGREHVAYHTAHPKDKQPRHIVQPGGLPRQRQLDLCGQCHSGEFQFLDQPFRFRPGDPIDRFHRLVYPDADQPDVHTSNQVTRLKRSECFQKSEMTCTTCHNPHQLQRGGPALLSKACLQCHEIAHCGADVASGVNVADDCISCHMPETQNADLDVLIEDGVVVRSVDHFIRVPEAQATER